MVVIVGNQSSTDGTTVDYTGPAVNLINLSRAPLGWNQTHCVRRQSRFRGGARRRVHRRRAPNVTFVEGHKSFTVLSPPGVGAQSEIIVSVGGQVAPLTSMLRTFAYALPAATTYSPRLTHEGGVEVIVNGTNFGDQPGSASVTLGGKPCVNVTLLEPHVALRCFSPPGQGAGLSAITVAGQVSALSNAISTLVRASHRHVPDALLESVQGWRPRQRHGHERRVGRLRC